jgi:hypothetical protein
MNAARKSALSAVFVATLLGGCANVQEFSFQPPTVSRGTSRTSEDASGYANELSARYLKAAGYTADGQQLLDITMIGAGTTAAGATTLGWSTHLLKVAALTAGAALGVRTYENGDGKIKALIGGTTALRCITNVVSNVPEALRESGQLPLDAWEAIDAVEERVAAQIMRQAAPDFTILAKVMSEQVNNAETKKGKLKLTRAGATDDDLAIWAAAPAKLTACIAKAG